MAYFYVYYSYEEWGRGYIGSKPSGCTCAPEDDPYLGSFKDKTFKPTHKIILGVYDNSEDCLQAEVLLHSYFEVDVNPHFANMARQTSKKFFCQRKGKDAVLFGVKGEKHPSWGRKRPQEVKDRISKSKKGKPRKDLLGDNHHMKRPEVREKVSGVNSVLFGVTGENHPCGGTKWYVNSNNERVRRRESPGPNWQLGRQWTQVSSNTVS